MHIGPVEVTSLANLTPWTQMATRFTEFLNFLHSMSRSRRVHLNVWHQPSPSLFSWRILQCLSLTFGKSLPESNTRNTAKDEFKYMSVSDYSSKGKWYFLVLLASTRAMHTSNLRQTTQKRGSADFTGFAQTK